MMSRGLLRTGLVACVLAASISTGLARPLPVFATPIRVTTGAAQSTVELILSSQNPIERQGTLTLVLEQAGGVTRTWVVPGIKIPPGNSYRRVLIPGAITGVRWARVTVTPFG